MLALRILCPGYRRNRDESRKRHMSTEPGQTLSVNIGMTLKTYVGKLRNLKTLFKRH